MQYQSDYVLRLIEQMGALIRKAMEKERLGGDSEIYALAEQAIGLALDIDPAVVARLSPASLASMLELSNLDDRVIELVAEALEIQAGSLEIDGEVLNGERKREQAKAVRGLLDPSRAN